MATSSTKYLRIKYTIELARDNAYSDPVVEAHTITDEIEVTRYKKQEYLAVTSTGTTVDLSEFGTIYKCIVHNRDASNYVDAAYDTVSDAAGSAASTSRVFAGETLVLTDIAPAYDLKLTANGAACEVSIEVYGTA